MCGCLQVERRDIGPFGSIPKKATGQVERSLSPSWTFLRALNLGIAGINATDQLHFSTACSRALLRMQHCQHCPGLMLSQPCMACCPSTMPGCLAGTAGVAPHWHSCIQCLQELSGALSRAHGTEQVLLNFHSLVRDALRQPQINGAEASEQGYRLSQKKAQMVKQTVIYLGYERFLKYQAIMVEQDDVEIVVTNTVNPASFLSGSMGEPVIHECLEAIEATCSSCLDLKDTLLENTETWSTDGSSCVISGRHAGYVVTMSREVIESGPLPTNTLAQKAEITALTRALELAKGKKVNIYTDLRYAFGVVQAHGAIWKERGLLN
ncbi:hypothetical protein DUI87_34140 [Hirundo rustica rustica]|uniref:RNase H type-1 domain-containing protein n=1 Tax=Hirundo rustica rustica TaxID=333673 RepID=A0A3M0ISK7_HIRRU|nr:hypothetical protein DUI87_34140 [Hirundo rustica rustica]